MRNPIRRKKFIPLSRPWSCTRWCLPKLKEPYYSVFESVGQSESHQDSQQKEDQRSVCGYRQVGFERDGFIMGTQLIEGLRLGVRRKEWERTAVVVADALEGNYVPFHASIEDPFYSK